MIGIYPFRKIQIGKGTVKWQLPDPPALISEEFGESLHAYFGKTGITIRRRAKYAGIGDVVLSGILCPENIIMDERGTKSIRDILRATGNLRASRLLFTGPRPAITSQTRKAKRLHREAMRLYKWRKKWAERQV